MELEQCSGKSQVVTSGRVLEEFWKSDPCLSFNLFTWLQINADSYLQHRLTICSIIDNGFIVLQWVCLRSTPQMEEKSLWCMIFLSLGTATKLTLLIIFKCFFKKTIHEYISDLKVLLCFFLILMCFGIVSGVCLLWSSFLTCRFWNTIYWKKLNTWIIKKCIK